MDGQEKEKRPGEPAPAADRKEYSHRTLFTGQSGNAARDKLLLATLVEVSGKLDRVLKLLENRQ